MTVECVPNPDVMDASDSSGTDTSDEDDESAESAYLSNEDVKNLDAAIDELRRQLADAEEEIKASDARIGILDRYGETLHSKASTPAALGDYLRLYGKERRDLYQVHKSSTLKMEQVRSQIQEKSLQRTKIRNMIEKAQRKDWREKMKVAQKKAQSREKRHAEKRRSKEQRLAFWPRHVYKVVVCLEASSDGGTASQQPDGKELQKKSSWETLTNHPVSLSFSYVTRGACWYPAYNVQLFTPSESGSIAYRAEFQNATSETWRNTKVVLSTSQTSFSGLVDIVPTMTPWHIRLVKQGAAVSNANQAFGSSAPVNAWDAGLESQQERNEKGKKKLSGSAAGATRGGLFGSRTDARPPAQPAPFGGGVRPSSLGVFGRSTVENTAGFGSSTISQPPPRHYQMQQQISAQPPGPALGGAREGQSVLTGGVTDPVADGPQDDDTSILSADTITGAVAFQESSREDQGLTTTFSLPGTRTLTPSHLKRRHLITDLPLSSVALSYEVIPKLRAAAFLKARIRNSSPMTLLRGRASLTLDGTFLGNTTLPRCSPDETFTLFLGIDPAIHVGYAKPTVRRSSSGLFSKEESIVYTRTTTITNTKTQNEAVELVVTDQVPVSEDERLSMGILQPAGLRIEGDKVKTGEGVTPGKWGKATATLKKNGEVRWDVTLNKGASCRLTLEYEAKIPASEVIVGLS